MGVLAITIFVSLWVAGFFAVMFLGSGHCSRHSLEQEALMPFNDDPPAKLPRARLKAPEPS
jgi:hypothetical protein